MNNFEQNLSVENSESVPIQKEPSVNSDTRFVDVKFEEVETLITNQINSNTIKKILREVNLIRKFIKGMKNEHFDVHEFPCNELDQLIVMFVLSVRKTDGQEYEPSSLRSIKKAVGGTDFLCMYITKNKQKQDQGKILSTNQIKPRVFSTGDAEIRLIFTNYMQPEDLYAIRQMRTLSTYNPFL